MTALTNKEKQASLRKRRATLGLKEMRGVWVSNDEEKLLKPIFRKMIEKHRKKEKDNEKK